MDDSYKLMLGDLITQKIINYSLKLRKKMKLLFLLLVTLVHWFKVKILLINKNFIKLMRSTILLVNLFINSYLVDLDKKKFLPIKIKNVFNKTFLRIYNNRSALIRDNFCRINTGYKICFEYTLKRKAFNIKQNNYISFQPINFAIKGPNSVVGAMIFNRGFKSIGFNLLNNTQYNTEKIYYNADKEKKIS